jgi:hypothetical protein
MREIIRYTQICTVRKRLAIVLSQKLFPAGESLVSDIQAGTGKSLPFFTVYNPDLPLFIQLYSTLFHIKLLSSRNSFISKD